MLLICCKFTSFFLNDSNALMCYKARSITFNYDK